MMRNIKLLSVLLLCMAVVFTSCGTWNNTAKGTAIGVGGGAAVHRIGQPQLVPQALEQP